MQRYPARIPASAFSSRKTYLPRDVFQKENVVAAPLPRENARDSIPRLREAIQSLDSKMAFLMTERHDLESRLEQAVRSQSPVLRLPSELLSSIFVCGVLEMGDENPLMVATLMLVCRYWSNVALDTPLLWSRISVSPHDSLEKARRKFSRSKSCPLEITVNFPQKEYPFSVMEQVVHAMDLVRPALWRTKTLSLSVPSRPQAYEALLRCKEDAPLLETLSIRVHHSMQDDHYSSPPLPLFNGQTPRLRSCSFASFNFGWDTRLVSHLRVLKLDGYFNGFSPSASTILTILRQCPELEQFSLRNIFPIDSGPGCHRRPEETDALPPAGRPLSMPRLTKLSFYCSNTSLTRQILSHISYPNVESIELCYLENVTTVLQLLYNQALVRLSLRYLRVEACWFSELNLMNLLRRLPSLVTLELVDVDDASSSLLKSLSSSQPWICPRLECLSLEGCTTLDWDSLRTFVESRLPANSYAYFRHQTAQSFRAAQVSTTSASKAAAARSKNRPTLSRVASAAVLSPQRLRIIDVTRCTQVSKEMVQWLRMYVSEVKCLWGEPIMT